MAAQIVSSKRLSPITYEVVVDDGYAKWYFHALSKRGAMRAARTRLRDVQESQ